MQSGDLICDKNWSKTVREDELVPALRAYLGGRSTASDIVMALDARLAAIEHWFAHQRMWHVYSSSVLLVFEGAEGASPDKVDVRAIDFTHVFDAHGELDQNYLFGIRNFRKYLKLAVDAGMASE